MAKNRKNQAAAIRFGPVVKVVFLCALFCGSAVGYVWQKSQIYQLGQQVHQRELQLDKLKHDNKDLKGQLAALQSPPNLDQRARALNLVPAQPAQVVRLEEPATEKENPAPPSAQRPTVAMAP